MPPLPEEPIYAAVVEPATVSEEADIGVVNYRVVEVEDLCHCLALDWCLVAQREEARSGRSVRARPRARTARARLSWPLVRPSELSETDGRGRNTGQLEGGVNRPKMHS